MPFTTNQLLEICDTASSIALTAGELLREAYDQPRQIDYKGKVDLVTTADKAAEELILKALGEHYPEHAIFAEESGQIEPLANNGEPSEYVWLIDPLDGTTNFAHAFPVFAVSIALHDQVGPLLGVVVDPLRDECFTAIKGQGAKLNGQLIQVSTAKTLDRSLLATGFPYDRHTAEDNNTATFAAFVRKAQGVRRAGAAALDLAYVACGRLDAFWEMRLHPWDVAAGILLVTEAGGTVTGYAGDDNPGPVLRGEECVASNGHIHPALIATLKEVYS